MIYYYDEFYYPLDTLYKIFRKISYRTYKIMLYILI